MLKLPSGRFSAVRDRRARRLDRPTRRHRPSPGGPPGGFRVPRTGRLPPPPPGPSFPPAPLPRSCADDAARRRVSPPGLPRSLPSRFFLVFRAVEEEARQGKRSARLPPSSCYCPFPPSCRFPVSFRRGDSAAAPERGRTRPRLEPTVSDLAAADASARPTGWTGTVHPRGARSDAGR